MKQERSAQIIQLPTYASQRAQLIVGEIESAVREKFDYLLDGMAINIHDALFEEMRDMDHASALQRHFNIMRAVKLHDAEFREEFKHLLAESWQIFLCLRDTALLQFPQGVAAELINAYKRKAQGHYKVLIADVKLRLSFLTAEQFDDFPLCPEIIYLCFWQATEKLELKYDERLVLIPLFQRFTMDRYGQILAIANRMLIDQDRA